MKFTFKNEEVYVDEGTVDPSIKLGNARIGNILVREDGNHLKCRSQAYADFLPTEYEKKDWYEDDRHYHLYITTAPVTDRQIEEWVNKCVDLGINKRLDKRA